MVNMLDFTFSTSDEITAELGLRLKAVRLSQSLTQADLAERAGISVGTVKSLERTGQSSVASLVRAVQALGLTDLYAAFLPMLISVPVIIGLAVALLKKQEA